MTPIHTRIQPKTSGHAPSPSQQAGYVLLFALGLLSVVATLVLGVTVSLRLDAQLATREKEALQETYLLQGAARYTAAQLRITSAVDALKLPPSDNIQRNWVLWRPSAEPYSVPLGASRVQAQIEDASGLPDANLLTAQEWQRIFMALGATTPQMAQTLALNILQIKQDLARSRGTQGFSSIVEILQWPELATAMAWGGTDKVPLGLRHLLVVGTRKKQVQLDSTPLLLLQAMGNVTDEQLQRLATLRRAGPLTPTQAQQWLEGTGLTAAPASALPAIVRVRLSLANSASALIATIASENGSYDVVDLLVDRGSSR